MARQRGFTLIELIVVMIVLGILSAIALPRMLDGRGLASAVFHADVVSALRYAQKSAVSHRRLVCATFTPTAVALAIATNNPDTSCATGAVLPSPDGAPYQSRDGSIWASGYPAGGVLYFQPAGTITSDGAGATIYSGNIAITGHAKPISIEGATGHVE